jgi:hypothetical protein
MKSKLNRSETLASPFGGGSRGRTFRSLRMLGVLVILFTIVLTSCNEEKKKKLVIHPAKVIEKIDTLNRFTQETDTGDFLKAKKLAFYKHTEFLPTMENEITDVKNSIYCVTLLYAWNEIRNVLAKPIVIDKKYKDLTLLHQSTSYQNVLDKGEYQTEIIFGSNFIVGKAKLKQSMPFIEELKGDETIFFNQKEGVKAFGCYGSNYSQSKVVTLAYYKSDKDCVVKFNFKKEDYEMILVKTDTKFNSIEALNTYLQQKIVQGEKEKKTAINSWKYTLNEEDYVKVPKFNFNIEYDFESIVGNRFLAKKRNWIISKAWQQNGFRLNENGMKLESEAKVVIFESIAEPYPDNKKKALPKKHIVFDKPFYLLLKKKNSKNPYFVMRIVNNELMERW